MSEQMDKWGGGGMQGRMNAMGRKNLLIQLKGRRKIPSIMTGKDNPVPAVIQALSLLFMVFWAH